MSADSLRVGLTHRLRFTVPESRTVPALYPESELFQQMPEVFATGFMVGLLEWMCLDAVVGHLDWPASRRWARASTSRTSRRPRRG